MLYIIIVLLSVQIGLQLKGLTVQMNEQQTLDKIQIFVTNELEPFRELWEADAQAILSQRRRKSLGDLKARIEQGAYHVSGEQIASAMLRRRGERRMVAA